MTTTYDLSDTDEQRGIGDVPDDDAEAKLFDLSSTKDQRGIAGLKYSPDQPRDELGRFSNGGGGESSGETSGGGDKSVEFDRTPTATTLGVHDALYEDHKTAINNLPNNQKSALREYMREGATQIAAASRGQDIDSRGQRVSESAKTAASNLNDAISANTLSADVTAYRGDSRLPNDIESAKQLIGTSIENPGVASTTIKAHAAVQFAGDGGVLRIAVPRGSRGLYAEAYWQSSKAESIRKSGKLGEAELLLPFGTNYKINAVSTVTDGFGKERVVYDADPIFP